MDDELDEIFNRVLNTYNKNVLTIKEDEYIDNDDDKIFDNFLNKMGIKKKKLNLEVNVRSIIIGDRKHNCTVDWHITNTDKKIELWDRDVIIRSWDTDNPGIIFCYFEEKSMVPLTSWDVNIMEKYVKL